MSRINNIIFIKSLSFVGEAFRLPQNCTVYRREIRKTDAFRAARFDYAPPLSFSSGAKNLGAASLKMTAERATAMP